LAIVDHGAKLGAVLNAAFLVVGEVGAQVDLRQLVAKALPAPAAILANESVALEENENDARFAARDAGLVGEVVEQIVSFEWHLLEHDRDLRRFLDVGIFPAEEIRTAPGCPLLYRRACTSRGAIASGTPGLLVVRLDRAGK
jgi:hypothetical protein